MLLHCSLHLQYSAVSAVEQEMQRDSRGCLQLVNGGTTKHPTAECPLLRLPDCIEAVDSLTCPTH